MKALMCREYGPPESMAIEELPSPVPAPDQIRIAIRAAGLNPNDWLKLRGEHHEKPELPFSPGSEVAGVVAAVGANVTRLKPGDRVMATLARAVGGFAEEVVVSADTAVEIPDDVDDRMAACFLSSLATAYDAVVHAGKTQAGETVVVLGAGGEVGICAVEIAKALGAIVIAVAGSQAKLARAHEAGADHLVHHAESPLRDTILAATNGRGADVIIDPVGGDAFREAFRALAWQGRLIVTGFASRDIPEIRTILLLLKGVSLCGSNLSQTARRDPEKYRAACAQLFAWHREGKIHSHVVAGYPLERVPEAMHRIARRDHYGKIVIEMARA